MNKRDIEKLEKSDGLVPPIKKDSIKQRIISEEKRQQKLRQKFHNKVK
jgi:hypothetical protein